MKPFTTDPANAVTNHVVISEFFYDETGTDNNEFVEIYNPTDSPVDISGWTVEHYNQLGAVQTNTVTIPSGVTLKAKGYYLIGEKSPLNSLDWGGTEVIPDLVRESTSDWQNGASDGIVLKDSEGNAVDGLEYGTDGGSSTVGEGTPAVDVAGQSLIRITDANGNYIDTDNNASDFVGGTPNPQNSTAATPIADARKAAVDTVVTVQGVVTAKFDKGGKTNYFIQDNTAGIVVRIAGFAAELGDRIYAEGPLKSFFGMAQVEPTLENVSVLQAGAGVPAPLEVDSTQLTESVEGQLVVIKNIKVDSVDANHNYTSSDAKGSFVIDSDTDLVKVGTEYTSITGVVDYNYNSFKITPRDAVDVVEGSIEEPTDPSVTTILDARSKADGTDVIIQGVVTHAENNTIMYIQDETSGVKIDTFASKVDLTSYSEGDEVKITGKTSTFSNEKQVSVAAAGDIVKLGTKSLPTPTTITLNELDAYEGQLVKVEMAKLTDVTTDRHSFFIEDLQKNTTKLYVTRADNFTKTNYSAGQYFNIVGISAKYNSPQLKLRNGDDMVQQDPPETAKIPIVYNVKPAKMASVTDVATAITGNIEEADTAIDWNSFKLVVDEVDVTTQTEINQTAFSFSYKPAENLAVGEHSISVEVADVAGAKVEYVSYFYVKELKDNSEYNYYFGVPHAHTSYSDGKGTPAEAYQMAYDNGLDYLIVTDHSNWLEGDKYVSERKEFEETVGSEWEQTKQQMNAFNAEHGGDFLALRGFEMTSTPWGHINVTNTNDYVEAKKTVTELGDFYEWLTTEENVVAAFNHPNWPSDSFNDLAYVPQIDHIMAMIEVGNGAPPYSYERAEPHFFRAMDNGWHVGAINGQDNHSANWGAPDNLTAVIAEDLTNESFIEAIKERRVYSTEARDTKLRVKANGYWMGSTLDVNDGSDLNFDIWVQDNDNPIDEIQIITNGGNIIESVKVGEKTEYAWTPTIKDGKGANWYVVKIIHTDSKWTTASAIFTSGGENDVKLTLLTVNPDPSVPGSETTLTATISNMGVRAAENLEVKFYRGSVSEENHVGTGTVAYVGPGKRVNASTTWVPEVSGQDKIIAVLTEIPDVTTVTKMEKTIKVVASNGKKVLVDSVHSNADVPGAMNNFMELLRRYGYSAKYNTVPYTAEVLAGYDVLVINAPDKVFTEAELTAINEWVKAGGSLLAASKSNFSFDNTKLNPLLEKIGSGIRINNDNVYEPNTSSYFSGGMKWSVYAHTMPATTSGLNANLDAIRYFSGASLVDENLGALTNDSTTGLEILVAGNKSSYNYNVKEGYHTYNPAIGGENDDNQTSGPDGDKIPLIAKEYVGEGRIIVAGRHFYSDFEIVNDVSNTAFTLDIMDWLSDYERIQDISEVRETAQEGDIVTVKGVVTAPTNKFFDTVYIQDETGGIALYGPQGKDLPVGTVVIATGGITTFEGEIELAFENFDMEILYVGPGTEVETRTVTSDEVTAGTYNGQLVKMTGVIKEINDEGSYMLVTDCKGDAYIHTDGYLPLGLDRFKVGDQIDVAGIASSGAAGNRIRVIFSEDMNFNTDELDCSDLPGDPGDGGTPGDGDGEDPTKQSVVEVKPSVKNGKATVETSSIETLADSGSLVVNLTNQVAFKVQFTKEQIEMLKEKDATIVIKNNDVEVQMPATNFPSGEVVVQFKRMKDIKGAVGAVYDFTITVNGNQYHVFDRHMKLVFKVDTKKVKNSENVTVLYYNEETKKWENIGGEYKDGVVTALTDHFSTFAAFEVSSDKDLTNISKPQEGYKLPNTATNFYNLLLLGVLITVAGGLTLFLQRRKVKQA